VNLTKLSSHKKTHKVLAANINSW